MYKIGEICIRRSGYVKNKVEIVKGSRYTEDRGDILIWDCFN